MHNLPVWHCASDTHGWHALALCSSAVLEQVRVLLSQTNGIPPAVQLA
jgi:hypothetical protein